MPDKTVDTRRRFLRMAGCFTVTAAALGLSVTDLAGLPVTIVDSDPAITEHRYPVPAADGVTIDKTAQVIVVRYQSHVYAFNLACPHQNQALRWLPKEGRFQCPKHESKYQPNGTFMNGRATRNMARRAARLDAGSRVGSVNKMSQRNKNPAGWPAATVTI